MALSHAIQIYRLYHAVIFSKLCCTRKNIFIQADDITGEICSLTSLN